MKPGTQARLRLVLFEHVATDEVAVLLNGVTLKKDLVDPKWKDARIFYPAPQPETVTPGWLVKDLKDQKLTRLGFSVPVGFLKRGENAIAIAVDRKGPFKKAVKVEKVELHLK